MYVVNLLCAIPEILYPLMLCMGKTWVDLQNKKKFSTTCRRPSQLIVDPKIPTYASQAVKITKITDNDRVVIFWQHNYYFPFLKQSKALGKL